MFTGIIETVGKILAIEHEGSNVHYTIASDLASTLKIDQSLAHNGVCLTVVDCNEDNYRVTAVEETLLKTNMKFLTTGSLVNLERAAVIGGRLDGHIVQGHVDSVGRCLALQENNGSWKFSFQFTKQWDWQVLIEKGSITINGVSLTVFEVEDDRFSVAIIPYTYQHTNFNRLKKGDEVNLEFDVIGKYVQKLMQK
ncbi:MAG: riboflavin synthase [Flavobacteriaceae bacterium]|nr:riboflavin synthase [Flavobacteriaceae bacterium]